MSIADIAAATNLGRRFLATCTALDHLAFWCAVSFGLWPSLTRRALAVRVRIKLCVNPARPLSRVSMSRPGMLCSRPMPRLSTASGLLAKDRCERIQKIACWTPHRVKRYHHHGADGAERIARPAEYLRFVLTPIATSRNTFSVPAMVKAVTCTLTPWRSVDIRV